MIAKLPTQTQLFILSIQEKVQKMHTIVYIRIGMCKYIWVNECIQQYVCTTWNYIASRNILYWNPGEDFKTPTLNVSMSKSHFKQVGTAETKDRNL